MHGLAMHGDPALAPDFAHLPYADPSAQSGGTLTLGEVGGFDSLNPFILKGRAPWVISSYTVETLLARSWDEPFSLYGLLAESVETPEDRSWVEFTLRREARFSDGTAVTPEDVIWSFETLGRQGHPRYRAAWDAVASIEATGERSVRIAFDVGEDGPNRELPLLMGLRPVLKKAEWEGRDFRDAAGLDPVTGSGPYVVEEAEPGRRLTLVRDPKWWGADLPVNRGLYAPERIRVDYFLNGDALWTAVRTGAIALFPDADPVRWAEGYAGIDRLVRHEIPHGRPTGMEGFVFNTRRGVFADRAVREAFALAFDWTWINQRLYAGQYARIESYWDNSELGMSGPADDGERALLAPFVNGLPDGTLEQPWLPPPGDGARNRRNLRKATALLEGAEWRLESGSRVRTRGGTSLTAEILVASSEHETVASIWAEALARLGAEVRVRRVDSAQYTSRRQTYDYDITVNRWYLSLSPGTEQWLYFGSDGRETPGTRNYMGVEDPAVDGMIRALVDSPGRPRFVAAARALDRVLSAGIYVVPFGVLPTDRVAALKGWRRPERSALYGFRPETWWFEPAE